MPAVLDPRDFSLKYIPEREFQLTQKINRLQTIWQTRKDYATRKQWMSKLEEAIKDLSV